MRKGGGGARCCALIFLPNLHKNFFFFEAEKRNSAHFIKGAVMCRFCFGGLLFFKTRRGNVHPALTKRIYNYIM